MPATTPAQILDALRKVQDPDLHQDIVSLGFVKKAEIQDGIVSVTINLTTPACPVKDQMKAQAEGLLRALPGVREVKVEMTAEVRGQQGGAPRVLAPEVRHILAVSSGKGGVASATRRASSMRCARSPPARSTRRAWSTSCWRWRAPT